MTLTPQLVRSALAIGRSPGTSAAELREFQDARLRRLLRHHPRTPDPPARDSSSRRRTSGRVHADVSINFIAPRVPPG